LSLDFAPVAIAACQQQMALPSTEKWREQKKNRGKYS
jgi:hypothetical protein